MALYAINGENDERETLAEKIERLEQEIEDLKSDVENERQRADNAIDELENFKESEREWLDTPDDVRERFQDSGYTIEELLEAQKDIDEGTFVAADEENFRAAEIAQKLKHSYERLNLGILSEIDEIIKLTDELISLNTSI